MTPAQLATLSLPCYLVDLPRLGAKLAAFEQAFLRHFPTFTVAVSYKTNYLPALLAALHRQGVWAEVVSELEVALAERLAVPHGQIVYNGPGKRPQAIAHALDHGCILNLDGLDEVDAVCARARQQSTQQTAVGLRINLALPDAAVAGTRSRFGISVADGQLAEAARRLRAAGVRIAGLHAHLTSRERALDHFRAVAAELVAAAGVVGEGELTYLDVGGGFGYVPPGLTGLSMPSFADYAQVLHETLAAGIRRLPELKVIAEPGIALVGDTMSYLAPVLAIKQLGGQDLCVIDGSVQTVKPTKHAVNLPTRALDSRFCQKDGPTRPWQVVGYTCLEDDVIARDIALPDLTAGDILVMDNVGAYTWVFKPTFIRPMPAFYVSDGTQCTLARAAQDVAHVFANDVFANDVFA